MLRDNFRKTKHFNVDFGKIREGGGLRAAQGQIVYRLKCRNLGSEEFRIQSPNLGNIYILKFPIC